MKKWLALVCIGILLFSCFTTFAETNKTFDHRQLNKFDGYEYNARDKSWNYYVSTYCMGQKSPNFFTDSHLVHIAMKASGNANKPESVDTMFSFLAMNTSGKIEDVATVTFIIKTKSEVVTITIDDLGVFCSENSEVLRYVSEGTHFAGIMTLENSTTTINFALTADEMAGIKEIASNLYKYNVADYVTGLMHDYAKNSITYSVQ